MGQRGSGGRHGRVRCTTEDSAVCGKETVLERLLQVALLEGFLLRHDLVQVLASVDGHLVATVAVVHAEERQALIGLAGFALYSGLRSRMQAWASSMLMRQPCMDEVPKM